MLRVCFIPGVLLVAFSTNAASLIAAMPAFPPAAIVQPEILPDGTSFIDAEKALRERFGAMMLLMDQAQISGVLTAFAESLPLNGAIDLPRSVACGDLDLRRIANGVQITGGWGGSITLGQGQHGIQMIGCRLDQIITTGITRKTRNAANLFTDENYKDVSVMEKTAPASDLLGLFCSGGIHIKTDVKHCAWIAGDNAFGSKTVTAEARVDDSLFLWFGINWPFQDYNGHQEAKNKGRNWDDHTQMWFNCKGGGQGTRLYEMIETNYGNPGHGVVLENCEGLSLFHGSTERPSAQGAGTYWLKNCKNVLLGLRAINSFASPGHLKSADPKHDITIEGGEGNMLYGIRAWGFAHEASAVNSDPKLQAWMASFQFETEGFDKPGILRFAYNENFDRPNEKTAAELKATLADKVARFLEKRKEPVSDDYKNRLERMVLTGRATNQPYDATGEQTFIVGGVDLTQPGVKPAAAIPPPPSIPPTDAPRLRRPIAFTQAADFGKAMLDAGADPTGNKSSDDAIAKVMYGIKRDELQKILEDSYAADKDYRTARESKDAAAMKAAMQRIEESVGRLYPVAAADPKNPKARKNRQHHRVELPPGTFLIEHPIVIVGQCDSVWGAGADKTTVLTKKAIKVFELHEHTSVDCLTIDGGRVGIAMTGEDHGDKVSPTLHAYVAGRDFYDVTFKHQTFAGLHFGNDKIDAMGGAEHDQNRYVDLKFIDTGDYGIYINTGMLDKWLCLHCEFSGQKKAGISIKFNNLIHGTVIGCSFKDIDGPAIDTMGGNAEIAYRPWLLMIDQCEFTECGNATSAAVDQGYGELMSILHSKIVTKNKTIFAGYKGSPQVCQDVVVDVKVADGAPAMVLRAVRNVQTARANGHVYKNVTCSGNYAFVNDSNAYNDFFAATRKAKNKIEPLNWDTNPAAHENAPKNGWVHPFLFYNCEFAGKKTGYLLMNADVDKGTSKQEIQLER